MKFCWCLPNLSSGSGYAEGKNKSLVVFVVASCLGQRKILDYLLAFSKHSKRPWTALPIRDGMRNDVHSSTLG